MTETINASDDKFWKLFRISLAGIFLSRLPKGEIIEINDSYLKMIGYTREEVIGHTSSEIGWLDAGERQKMIDTFYANNYTLVNYEIGFTKKTGEKGTALYSGTMTEFNGEKCVLVTVQDITERKKAEEQIKENEEKFRRLYNISHVGISVSRLPKGEVIEINDSYLNMIGYAREEVLGRTSSEVGWLDPGERQKMLDIFFANNNTIEEYEIGFTKKSKQKGTALFSAVLIELNGEKCVLVTVQDITERKKAEEKIKENEEKFRKVFDISPSGIALMRSDSGQIIEINDTYLNIIGYTRPEVIGHTSVDVGWLDPGARQRMLDKANDNTNAFRNYEMGFTRKSGQTGTALFAAVPIEISGEKYLLVTVQDVTERKKAEEKIKENEEKFRKLFNMSQAGIALIHFPSTRIVEINDSYLKMIGYERSEVIGHTSIGVGWFDPAERQKMIDAFYHDNQYMLRDYEIGFTTKSKKKGAALVSYDQIELNGEIYLLATVQDITQRLEQEKRKTELLEQLKQANQELESFTFTVSHDLRAPLRAIGGYIQILQLKYGENLSEDEKQLIDRIKIQTKRMGNLIDDLLAFSRQNKTEITKAPVDMTNLAKDVVDEYTTPPGEQQVTLHDLLPAYGDNTALRQVFVNLITNALKYSAKKEHPVIEIGSYAKGNENIYFVKDNGAGFDMKYYDQLFKVFHRLHSQEEFEGNGVGLAIVNKIVTKHGGRVWAEGKVDEGATFYFSLPKE
jgi:PAS domain S-box-containing protein